MSAPKLTKKIIFSGIQPSGFLHLGNYLGAVQNWVKIQDDKSINDLYFSVVDYHSITQKYIGLDVQENIDGGIVDDPSLLLETVNKNGTPQELTLKTVATLLACGINPNKSKLFVQSHIQAISELQWFLSSLTPLSWLNKMIQFKEKKGQNDKLNSLGLYSYPVLMASDILCFKATHVPVGDDQIQHLELSRDIAERFNRIFGELFPMPKRLQQNDFLYSCDRVMSLQSADKKMSKSDQNLKSCINMIDDPDVIRLKIRKSKTDSLGKIKYSPKDRPELANLLRIYSAIEGIPVLKVDQLFEDDNMFSFKEKLSNVLINKICPIGEKTLDLCNNHEDLLLDIVDKSAIDSQRAAEATLLQLKKQVGLLRRKD